MQLKHFKPKEFACNCKDNACGLGYDDMNTDALLMLDKARDISGVPFKVNSPIRCEEHNLSIGASPDSSHVGGYAIDVAAVDSHTRFKIVKALLDVGFKRIGVNPRFIHVDNDPDKPQEVMFLY